MTSNKKNKIIHKDVDKFILLDALKRRFERTMFDIRIHPYDNEIVEIIGHSQIDDKLGTYEDWYFDYEFTLNTLYIKAMKCFNDGEGYSCEFLSSNKIYSGHYYEYKKMHQMIMEIVSLFNGRHLIVERKVETK